MSTYENTASMTELAGYIVINESADKDVYEDQFDSILRESTN